MNKKYLLYDHVYEDDKRFSPYCFRVKAALKHKGLDYDTIGVCLSDKETIAFSGQTFVPILVVDNKKDVICDSFAIAEYLDKNNGSKPLLFHGAANTTAVRIFCRFVDKVLNPAILLVIIRDIHRCLDERDRVYFKSTREKRLGKSIDQITQERPMHMAALRNILEVVEGMFSTNNNNSNHSSDNAFLFGDSVSYADIILWGSFKWGACFPRFFQPEFMQYQSEQFPCLTKWWRAVEALFSDLTPDPARHRASTDMPHSVDAVVLPFHEEVVAQNHCKLEVRTKEDSYEDVLSRALGCDAEDVLVVPLLVKRNKITVCVAYAPSLANLTMTGFATHLSDHLLQQRLPSHDTRVRVVGDAVFFATADISKLPFESLLDYKDFEADIGTVSVGGKAAAAAAAAGGAASTTIPSRLKTVSSRQTM